MAKDLENKFRNMSFLAVCLVVAQHLSGFPDWVGPITAIAVPWFFFQSGFLFIKVTSSHSSDGVCRGYVALIKRKIKTLLVPYVVWNFVYWFFLLSMAWVCGLFGKNYDGMGWASVSPDIIISTLVTPCLPPTWFLSALFCVFLTAAIPILALRDFRIGCIALLLAVAGLVLVNPSDLWLCRFFRGMMWFVLGCVFARFDLLNFSLKSMVVFVGVCALGAIRVLPGGGVLLALALMPSVKLPSWMINNSFHIYLLHYFFVCVFASKIFGRVEWLSVSLGAVVKMLLILIFSIGVTETLRRILPRLVFKVTFGLR